MPAATANGGLGLELQALGANRLARLVLSIAHLGHPAVGRIIDDALRGGPAADPKARPDEAAAEPDAAEPYMVGTSAAMQRVYASIRRFAATDAPLLITGESGTGKELAALAVHERSSYGRGPFVAINCAALSPTLIAAELFGYEKGAFTGAMQRRIGRLESAKGGTIFLDEIGDLPLDQQAHLLRFLQEHTIDRVGGNRPIAVDARVICATNSDLRGAVQARHFREDLFYRLNVLTLEMPPLRERGEDLELLARFFVHKFAGEQGRAIAGFSEGAWQAIATYDWPGNVRELIGCVRRAVVMAETPWIATHDLGLERDPPVKPGKIQRAVLRRPVLDEGCLREALRANGGNIARAARALDVSRMTIYRLMRRFGMQSRG